MSSRRVAKVARAIKEIVSTAILFELKDPRIQNVTVLNVEVSSDLRYAKVYCSVMGDERTQQLSMQGLNSARGFLQAKLASQLQIRYTPILRFVLDQGVKKSIETSRLLRQIQLEEQQRSAAKDGAGSEEEAASAEEIGPSEEPPQEQ